MNWRKINIKLQSLWFCISSDPSAMKRAHFMIGCFNRWYNQIISCTWIPLTIRVKWFDSSDIRGQPLSAQFGGCLLDVPSWGANFSSSAFVFGFKQQTEQNISKEKLLYKHCKKNNKIKPMTSIFQGLLCSVLFLRCSVVRLAANKLKPLCAACGTFGNCQLANNYFYCKQIASQ